MIELSTTCPRAITATQRLRDRVGVYLELGKFKLSMLVVVTAGVGFILAAPLAVDWSVLGWTVLGTTLAALAANAFNQVWEVDRDRRMRRTRERPLPSDRIGRAHAIVFAATVGVIGVAVLALAVHIFAALLAAGNIALYVLVYTPLKPRSVMNTLIGAVVGAVPPMIGWVAATGRLSPGAWALAAVLFVWQIPHFLSLAWCYREDYRSGGFRMLPIVDEWGDLTCRVVLMYCAVLLPVTVSVALVGAAGLIYAAGAVLLGMWMLLLGVRLYRRRSQSAARRLFLASVIYLPLLMLLMLLDPAPRLVSDAAPAEAAARPAAPTTGDAANRLIPAQPEPAELDV